MSEFETKIKDKFIVPKSKSDLDKILSKHMENISREILHKEYISVEIVTTVKDGKISINVKQ